MTTEEFQHEIKQVGDFYKVDILDHDFDELYKFAAEIIEPGKEMQKSIQKKKRKKALFACDDGAEIEALTDFCIFTRTQHDTWIQNQAEEGIVEVFFFLVFFLISCVGHCKYVAQKVSAWSFQKSKCKSTENVDLFKNNSW